MASRLASMIVCMSSAEPMTPSTATDLWAAIDSSRPGRRVLTNRVRELRVQRAAQPVDGPVLGAAHRGGEAQFAGPAAAPGQRRLPARSEVVEAPTVGAQDHGRVAVGRIVPHHCHPGHGAQGLRSTGAGVSGTAKPGRLG